ncbi:MAG: DUF4430 domain-containing protein [Clostridiales bacterium]|nr:DUF4430 domain-containing protein [Clostridiales bacterium]
MKKLLIVALMALLLALPLPVLAAVEESAAVDVTVAVYDGDAEEWDEGPPAVTGEEEPLPKYQGIATQDIVDLLENMVKQCAYNGTSYKDSRYEWLIMDMAAYAGLFSDSAGTTTAAARQAYIDNAINSLADPDPGPFGSLDNIFAKAVLGLRAVGIDPADLITVNKRPLNAVSLLKTTATTSIYNAPYVLLAYQQGSYDTAAAERSLVTFILGAQLSNGAWGWGDTLDTADPDGTAMVLQCLARYYTADEDVKAAVDKALAYLSAEQDLSGAYISTWTGGPSADTMAQVILALTAFGLDPDTDARFVKEHSLLAGLLALRDEAEDGFFDYSNEQAFRALIAVAGLRQLDKAYNFYDFTYKPAAQGVATGLGSKPSIPKTESTTDITVYFTLKGLDGTWINRAALTVPQDAKVYHVVIKALAGRDYRQTGAESGYVSSVTRPNGTVLSEFEHGPNSGWLYKVGDFLPSIGLTSYTVKSGDHILLYYTKDWTLDSEAGQVFGGGGSDRSAVTAEVTEAFAEDAENNAYKPMAPIQAAGTKAEATKTNNPLILNGEKTVFPAIKVSGYNWLKLRDFAALLMGTSKQFSLVYDPETRIIDIRTGQAYTPLGDELEDELDDVTDALATSQRVRVDGEFIDIAAYNVAGYNYFRLRDLAIILDFYVDYNEDTGEITLDLSKPYSEE